MESPEHKMRHVTRFSSTSPFFTNKHTYSNRKYSQKAKMKLAYTGVDTGFRKRNFFRLRLRCQIRLGGVNGSFSRSDTSVSIPSVASYTMQCQLQQTLRQDEPCFAGARKKKKRKHKRTMYVAVCFRHGFIAARSPPFRHLSLAEYSALSPPTARAILSRYLPGLCSECRKRGLHSLSPTDLSSFP